MVLQVAERSVKPLNVTYEMVLLSVEMLGFCGSSIRVLLPSAFS